MQIAVDLGGRSRVLRAGSVPAVSDTLAKNPSGWNAQVLRILVGVVDRFQLTNCSLGTRQPIGFGVRDRWVASTGKKNRRGGLPRRVVAFRRNRRPFSQKNLLDEFLPGANQRPKPFGKKGRIKGLFERFADARTIEAHGTTVVG